MIESRSRADVEGNQGREPKISEQQKRMGDDGNVGVRRGRDGGPGWEREHRLRSQSPVRGRVESGGLPPPLKRSESCPKVCFIPHSN